MRRLTSAHLTSGYTGCIPAAEDVQVQGSVTAPPLNLLAGWLGMLAGVASGALIGLHFHEERWLGGYGTFRRRLLRLGHISFFGLGFLNILFTLTADAIDLRGPHFDIASTALVLGAITMPACCFLSAWREPFRVLFPIPVIAVASGIVSLLLGWPRGLTP